MCPLMASRVWAQINVKPPLCVSLLHRLLPSVALAVWSMQQVHTVTPLLPAM